MVINLEKFRLCSTQTAVHLGMRICSKTFLASPTLERRLKLLGMVEEFLSSEKQPAVWWRSLLGHLSSRIQLISLGRLWVRCHYYWFSVGVGTSWTIKCGYNGHLSAKRTNCGGATLLVSHEECPFTWSNQICQCGWTLRMSDGGAHLGSFPMAGSEPCAIFLCPSIGRS